MAFHHLRARTNNKYPFLDKILYVAGLVSIFMMIPQIRLIYATKIAAGIEPITWIVLAILDIPWIIYGILHREKPFILIYSLWLIANFLVFLGSVLY